VTGLPKKIEVSFRFVILLVRILNDKSVVVKVFKVFFIIAESSTSKRPQFYLRDDVKSFRKLSIRACYMIFRMS
jgi:hypothetical protein